MTSLPLVRVFECLLTSALVSASLWLAKIWHLSQRRDTGELEVEFKFHRRSCKLSFRLSQSRSLGFLVWCGRTRHEHSFRSLALRARSLPLRARSLPLRARTIALRAHSRATRSKARLVSKSSCPSTFPAPSSECPRELTPRLKFLACWQTLRGVVGAPR